MLRWAVSQIRGQSKIPTHSEADAIARRLMLLEGASDKMKNDSIR